MLASPSPPRNPSNRKLAWGLAGLLLSILLAGVLTTDFPCNDPYDDASTAMPGDGISTGLVVRKDLRAKWRCADVCCNQDYLALPDRAPEHAAPISEAELHVQLNECIASDVQVLTSPMPTEHLDQALTEAMNLGFLLDGIDQRTLTVTTIAIDRENTFERRELLFTDPYVGTFQGILLLPPGDGPFPAVVALHGHLDSAEVFQDQYNGRAFPGRGMAILMLTSRATDTALCEHTATRRLLLNGFTLVSLRVYETALALRYLRHRSDIDGVRIGLIGQSGGSVASNLTIRVLPDAFRAYVSDANGSYVNGTWGESGSELLDETAPALFGYHVLVNDFSSAGIPVLSAPYAYASGPDGIVRILDFFESHL